MTPNATAKNTTPRLVLVLALLLVLGQACVHTATYYADHACDTTGDAYPLLTHTIRDAPGGVFEGIIPYTHGIATDPSACHGETLALSPSCAITVRAAVSSDPQVSANNPARLLLRELARTLLNVANGFVALTADDELELYFAFAALGAPSEVMSLTCQRASADWNPAIARAPYQSASSALEAINARVAVCDEPAPCVPANRCFDGEECTRDVCLPDNACDHPPAPNDQACNAALTTECVAYVCYNAQCLPDYAASGTPCSAASACVQTAACDGNGRCVVGQEVTCTAADGDPCTTGACNTTTGECAYVTDPTCTPCSGDSECVDSNLDDCLVSHCADGICHDGYAPEDQACVPSAGAPELDLCHTYVCNLGTCVQKPVEVGTQCSTGNKCAQGETCSPSGTCMFATITSCEPSAPCMEARCDVATGECAESPLPDCTAGCTEDADCATSSDLCAIPTCNVSAGTCSSTQRACDDGNACTHDYCGTETGQCVHEAKVCAGADPCHPMSCAPATGTCEAQPTPCQSNDACHVSLCQVGPLGAAQCTVSEISSCTEASADTPFQHYTVGADGEVTWTFTPLAMGLLAGIVVFVILLLVLLVLGVLLKRRLRDCCCPRKVDFFYDQELQEYNQLIKEGRAEEEEKARRMKEQSDGGDSSSLSEQSRNVERARVIEEVNLGGGLPDEEAYPVTLDSSSSADSLGRPPRRNTPTLLEAIQAMDELREETLPTKPEPEPHNYDYDRKAKWD